MTASLEEASSNVISERCLSFRQKAEVLLTNAECVLNLMKQNVAHKDESILQSSAITHLENYVLDRIKKRTQCEDVTRSDELFLSLHETALNKLCLCFKLKGIQCVSPRHFEEVRSYCYFWINSYSCDDFSHAREKSLEEWEGEALQILESCYDKGMQICADFSETPSWCTLKFWQKISGFNMKCVPNLETSLNLHVKVMEELDVIGRSLGLDQERAGLNLVELLGNSIARQVRFASALEVADLRAICAHPANVIEKICYERVLSALPDSSCGTSV